MELILAIILAVIGLYLLIKGADWLVDGSADLARYWGVPALIVGLTIVAFGTSLPELVISLISGIQGAGDIVTGNIIGSNIANIGLIIGITALIYPLRVKSSTIKYELPFMVISAFAFVVLANHMYLFQRNELLLDRFDGIIFLLMFCLFMTYIFSSVKNNKDKTKKEFNDAYKSVNTPWKNAGLIIIGLICLVAGGKIAVNSLVSIAETLHISEKFIGLTIVAIGTSLPELVTSIVAALKKEPDIAIGNIVGSNIFNILWVLGFVSVVHPIVVNPAIAYFDSIIMILFTLLFVLFASTKNKINRTEGVILISMYITYIIILAQTL